MDVQNQIWKLKKWWYQVPSLYILNSLLLLVSYYLQRSECFEADVLGTRRTSQWKRIWTRYSEQQGKESCTRKPYTALFYLLSAKFSMVKTLTIHLPIFCNLMCATRPIRWACIKGFMQLMHQFRCALALLLAVRYGRRVPSLLLLDLQPSSHHCLVIAVSLVRRSILHSLRHTRKVWSLMSSRAHKRGPASYTVRQRSLKTNPAVEFQVRLPASKIIANPVTSQLLYPTL